MKAIQSPLCCAAGGLCHLLGLHGPAAASVTTVHATACKPGGDLPNSGLWLYQTGVKNLSSDYLEVVCPVPRLRSASATSLKVWVDGSVPPGYWMTCRLVSTNAGRVLGIASFNVNGDTAPFDLALTLLGSYFVPDTSAQFVACGMPPGAMLFDIEPDF